MQKTHSVSDISHIVKKVARKHQIMATLRLLISDDPRIAGILITFPSNEGLEITWSARAPIKDTRKEAQSYATALVDTLRAGGMQHHIDNTNWASMVAAIQKHLTDFNERLRMALTPTDHAPH
jgi:hypothetical protein